jgi:glycosyltransferase involved in cell wall biosynthesis
VRADVLIVQRKLLHPLEVRRLRRIAPVLIYDFDDAVFLRDSYATRNANRPRRLNRFRAIAQAADLITAGNSFLAEYARQAAGKDHVRVLPTCVNLSRHQMARHRRSEGDIKLVWLGSSSTLKSLEANSVLLEQIGARFPGIRLKLICDRFIKFRNLLVERCPWSEQTETRELADADIGISWLPDDDWSRGKCGLKALQYMATGLPVVANPVGVQREMIGDGENGFLATTPAEWMDAIGRLARDTALRTRMGEAGRARVAADYSVEAGAAQWLGLLQGLSRRLAA